MRAEQGSPYFLRMPVSVMERLFTAFLAAGVVTSFPEDAGELVLGLVLMPPITFPEEPRLRALSVAGVFDPPVPLVVLPVESELPDAPLVEAPPRHLRERWRSD